MVIESLEDLLAMKQTILKLFIQIKSVSLTSLLDLER